MAEAVVVVGLVLGALPLVISALEHYRDGLDPVIDFWRYDATLRDLQIQLRIEQDLYQGTLKRLLLSELSQQQLEALFPDPGEPQRIALWETNEVNQKLRFKLGKRYDIFMDAVQVMDTTIKKLMEKLDIDAQGKPKWTSVPESRSRIGWEWRRIRRSFGRREREALINKFGQYNAKVAAWVQNNEILAPPSEARVESSTAYFHSVRDHASRLYSILEHGWSCNCIDPHNVHLQLDQRNVTQDPPSFQVCFSHYPQSSGGGQSQWLWQKTQIHLEEMKEGLLATSSSAHTASVRLDHTVSTPITPSGELERTSQINPARLPSKSKVRKAVRFQGTSPMFAPIPHTAQIEANTNQLAEPVAQIACLCKAIRNTQNLSGFLGFLSHPFQKQGASITMTPAISADARLPLTLGSLLSSKQKSEATHSELRRLSREQRLKVAVTLASTVLQLYESPWLDEMWGKNEICFFPNGLDEDNYPCIGDPYVSRSFVSPTAKKVSKQSIDTAADQFASSQIINNTLFALGIMLIELCLNRPFEDLHLAAESQRSKNQLDSIATNYRIIKNAIDDVYAEGGTQYGYVVQRCLRCEFGVQDSKKNLNLDTFRSLVYEGVLAPLVEIHKKYAS